jgi:hypothetical protein
MTLLQKKAMTTSIAFFGGVGGLVMSSPSSMVVVCEEGNGNMQFPSFFLFFSLVFLV